MKDLRTLVASVAANQRKASKAKALDALLSIIDNDTEQQLGKGDLATLYSFFLPPVPKTPNTPFDWVAKAAGRNDVRDYLNGVWSMQNGDIVATNGHILHLVKQEGSTFDKSTMVDSAGNVLNPSRDFVDYERIITNKEYSTPLNGVYTSHTINTDRKKTPLVKVTLKSGIAECVFTVNTSYWDNALCGLGDNPTIYWNEHNHQSLIVKNKDESRLAVIMPIKP